MKTLNVVPVRLVTTDSKKIKAVSMKGTELIVNGAKANKYIASFNEVSRIRGNVVRQQVRRQFHWILFIVGLLTFYGAFIAIPYLIHYIARPYKIVDLGDSGSVQIRVDFTDGRKFVFEAPEQMADNWLAEMKAKEALK